MTQPPTAPGIPDASPGSRRYRSQSAETIHLAILRIWIVITVLLAFNYLIWRWLASINWANWWIGVPLVLAETYSVIDLTLFSLTVWKARQRPEPDLSPPDRTVDVFITTYNEPIDLVVRTATAAQRIRHPHRTWILDDGDRPELRQAAASLGVDYLTRGKEWEGKPRHAKAGNLNNALMETTGEFILVLDADMIPKPDILDRTLGYFDDPHVGLVQTPQYFVNVPVRDPLGSQAPLFYGPIQEGKDGWGAAFFCGSNAVLRREALMELGILGYVNATEASVLAGLKEARAITRRALRGKNAPAVHNTLASTLEEINHSISALGSGEPIADVTYALRSRITELSRSIVDADLRQLSADLAELGLAEEDGTTVDADLADRLAGEDLSPLNALDAVQRTLAATDVGRSDEAQALLPMATISVTEDMATSMRLHANGWKSVYHNEVLADGLAPESLKTSLAQRLRWAQGTVQVLLKDNPLFLKGLTGAQRLMYFSTMWSYFSGFATVIYLIAPTLFLIAGVLPVASYAAPFFLRFLPFMIANQLLFVIAARGLPTWRGQQYTLALFPLWIKACTSAAANVWFGRPLNFAVTPKTGTHQERVTLRDIGWQLGFSIILIVAIVIGTMKLIAGSIEPIGSLVNIGWVAFDVINLSVLIGALRYRGFHREEE